MQMTQNKALNHVSKVLPPPILKVVKLSLKANFWFKMVWLNISKKHFTAQMTERIVCEFKAPFGVLPHLIPLTA